MVSLDQLLQAKAVALGKLALQATTAAGSGHPSTALSLAHVTSVLMYHIMRWDPENPAHPGSDRLVLSESHAVPIIYAACADLGVKFEPKSGSRRLTVNDLLTLRDIDSVLDGHPNPKLGFPFFDAATGSPGQGLSVAAGLAAAAKMDGVDRRVFCIIGDGEAREGQVWEAMDFIAEHQLTNVIPIFNCNELGRSGWVSPGQRRDAIHRKAENFGFKAVRCNGHDPAALARILNDYLRLREGWKKEAHYGEDLKPLALVVETVKGWGTSAEGLAIHGQPVNRDEIYKVLAQMDETARQLGVDKVQDFGALSITKPPEVKPAVKTAPVADFTHACKEAGVADAMVESHKLSPRRAFGMALNQLGKANPNVVGLDADVRHSTFAADFARNYPDRFLECRIAEQNMVSAAVGVCAGGKIPFVSTFGRFLVRAYDQVEMGIISGAELKLVGTHVGVTVGADGPSQMAVADVAFMRTFTYIKDYENRQAMVILTPSDAVSAYALTVAMTEHHGSVYLRALRDEVPLLYSNTTKFPLIGHQVLRVPKDKKALVVVASGYMVHSCLAAAELLADKGIDIAVVDAYSIPADVLPIVKMAENYGGKILTVEDNYIGGLDAEFASAIAQSTRIILRSLNLRKLPKSGKTAEDVLAYCHLDESDIIAAIKEFVEAGA